MSRSEIRRWPMAFSTGWCITRTGLKCVATRCGRKGEVRSRPDRTLPGVLCAERGTRLRPFPRTPFLLGHFSLRCAPEVVSPFPILDEAEHLFHNQITSVASLRALFDFTPESCSPCLRNGVRFRRNRHVYRNIRWELGAR